MTELRSERLESVRDCYRESDGDGATRTQPAAYFSPATSAAAAPRQPRRMSGEEELRTLPVQSDLDRALGITQLHGSLRLRCHDSPGWSRGSRRAAHVDAEQAALAEAQACLERLSGGRVARTRRVRDGIAAQRRIPLRG